VGGEVTEGKRPSKEEMKDAIEGMTEADGEAVGKEERIGT
jgi:hypothetical protein